MQDVSPLLTLRSRILTYPLALAWFHRTREFSSHRSLVERYNLAIDFSTVKREEQQSRVGIANISSIDVIAVTIVAIAAARMRVIQLSAAIYWLSDHPTNLSVDTPILS
ncbi:hypothetical protein HZH68_005168 [Vespula germanica]|uniref:Uncharacterized protein n=1 Tax=Vespula germanica TaxID=30212 RepID=A0A834NF61_VESGE|nr:hypothetical protein HZH68_005168 [Vespula germanica]